VEAEARASDGSSQPNQPPLPPPPGAEDDDDDDDDAAQAGEVPEASISDWEEHVGEAGGGRGGAQPRLSYWYNTRTGETSWEPPPEALGDGGDQPAEEEAATVVSDESQSSTGSTVDIGAAASPEVVSRLRRTSGVSYDAEEERGRERRLSLSPTVSARRAAEVRRSWDPS
jgi:hypothetical protein